MIELRNSAERGHTQLDWLDSRHSFSFGDYYDPARRGFGVLRVINEDWVAPGRGFPTHGHRDMEIITYVLEGGLEHRDSLGNGSLIRPGEVQRMSAGRGVTHSEHNPSRQDTVHLLQIWIEPHTAGLAPGYEQTAFPAAEKQGRWRLIASPDGREGSVHIHQDATLWAALLAPGETLAYRPAPGRRVYLHLAWGGLRVNGVTLAAGDGAAIRQEGELTIEADGNAELLLFDLP